MTALNIWVSLPVQRSNICVLSHNNLVEDRGKRPPQGLVHRGPQTSVQQGSGLGTSQHKEKK